LAGCYARLGDRKMAISLLQKLEKRRLHVNAIKVWGDLGETERAVKLCARFAKNSPADAAMYAADACRVAGRTKEAIAHYEKVLAVPAAGNQKARAGAVEPRSDRAL
jgi:thioredoxin-like negative regulator of GroEL